MPDFPVLMHTALDATDCRGLAEFYREFLGLRYRPGDEIPADGNDEGADWLVLIDSEGNRVLAFQEVPSLARPTWPSHDVPKQMHHECPASMSSSGNDSERNSWARRCSTTAQTIRVSRCTCWPIPQDTPSAFSWEPSSRPGATSASSLEELFPSSVGRRD